MKTRVEIYGDGHKDKRSEGATQTLCTKKLQKDPEDHKHDVHSHEEQPNPPDHAVKKRRHDGSTKCVFDRLPQDILHDILSRLSISELLTAARTCLAWRRLVCSPIFQKFYDERNEESWIALGSNNPHDFRLFHMNSTKWYSFRAREDGQYQLWFPKGAANGVILLVSQEGKLALANPLTGQIRLLPDTQVTPRLSLQYCLKRRGATTTQMKVCLNMIVDPADDKSFKVIVFGELRTRQVHLLVYSSATDTWSRKLCSEVQCRFLKLQIISTVDGDTIYFTSVSRFMLASYNIATSLFVALQFLHWHHRMLRVDRVQTIGIVAYRTKILLFRVIVGHDFEDAYVGLWQGNPTGGEWEFLGIKLLTFPSLDQIVAAYDGNSTVTIIQRMRSVMMLNLDSKEWKTTLSDPTATHVTTPADADSVWAFHMKLKFCTAL